jgi:hypothetical protein
LAFCESIDASPPIRPVFLKVQPVPGAEIGDCHLNVLLHIEKHGGSIQYGWVIWERTAIFLEAEFHSVWVNPQGQWIDVTPQIEGEDDILFFPVNNTTYDIASGEDVPNRRLALSDDPLVMRYLAAMERSDSFRQDLSPEFEKRQLEIAQLSSDLTMKYGNESQKANALKQRRLLERAKRVSELNEAPPESSSRTPIRRVPKVGRNDPCPCGSGKKYKKCCGG